MGNFQTLLDILIEKDIIGEEELKHRSANILERLKPKNFLTPAEVEEVRVCLDGLEIKSPKGWAEALYLHSLRDAKKTFSPNRAYCESCLINLRSTLDKAGLKNQQIDIKLAKTILFAQTQKVNTCQFE
jgi:hypothetical protein